MKIGSQQKKEQLNTVLKESRMGIWELSVKEKCIIFSGDFSGLLRFNSESPISIKEFTRQLQPLLKQSENRILFRELKQLLKEEKELIFREKKIGFPDGTAIYIRCSSKTLYNMNGEPERIMGMIWDVTETVTKRMALEEELQFLEKPENSQQIEISIK